MRTGAAGLSVLQHIATAAALEVVEEYRQRGTRRSIGAEVLAELLPGRLTADRQDRYSADLGSALRRRTHVTVRGGGRRFR
jgi:hypothetical protein